MAQLVEAAWHGRALLILLAGLLIVYAASTWFRHTGFDTYSRSQCCKVTQLHAGSSPVRLFVGVLSGSQHKERRDAVRATWGADPRLHRVLFFMARPADDMGLAALRREAEELRDIAMLPFVTESYFNITHQTLEMCRLAAADPTTTHLLKADDDSYVRVTALLAALRQLPAARMTLGRFRRDHWALREPGHLWTVSRDDWAPDLYPTFANGGGGYVLTADLARKVPLLPHKGSLFKLEDVAMGMWLQWVEADSGVNITRVDIKGVHYFGCLDDQGGLLEHYIAPDDMRCMAAHGGRCCYQGQVTAFRRWENGTYTALPGSFLVSMMKQ